MTPPHGQTSVGHSSVTNQEDARACGRSIVMELTKIEKGVEIEIQR